MTTVPQTPTTFKHADALISQLASHKETWVQLSIKERITYLHRCIEGVMAVAQSWAAAACCAKGIDPDSALAGEEWLAGPITTIRNLRLLVKAIAANGKPQPRRWHTRANGQQVAEVFPEDLMDKLLWMGFAAEVWIEPGKPLTQGTAYRETHAGIALVLGAGNVSSIAAMDTLYKLFVENQVVLLKINPVNEYIGPFVEQAFQSLCDDGFLHVVYGGAELGSYVCHHAAIDTIHITGSHYTHDAIVWGSTQAEQAKRKAINQPLLSKPITSELGCVTPILVVPGNWSKTDITFQARHIASMVAHNASFNCAAAQVVVTAKGWQQRAAFLAQLRQELATIPVRQAYYPGAQQRYQAFLAHYPQAQVLAAQTAQVVPWTLVTDVPAKAGEYALTQEAFCGVLAEVSLDVTNAKEFLTQAVDFANHKVWGTLSCTLLVDSSTAKNLPVELEQAIAALRYGGIGINVWTGVVYSLGVTTWGAFPGHPLTDICSGRGVVHNTYLFDYPQKSVVRAPFRIMPTPAWFATHKNLLQLAKQLIAFEAAPSWDKLLSVVLAALRG